MRVVFANRTPRPAFEGEGCCQVSFDELLACADIITLHCAAAPETENIIDARTIAAMKDGVRIVNTARGTLIDEQALRDALDCGKVAGAALDVIAVEPMRPECPLLGAPNTVITPHIAWATVEARTRLFAQIAENGAPSSKAGPATWSILRFLDRDRGFGTALGERCVGLGLATFRERML